MNTEITNKIQSLLMEHYAESGIDQFMVRDLLTDIRHFCDQSGLDFQLALKSSEEVYLEENIYYPPTLKQ